MEFPEIILDISSISLLGKPDHDTIYDMLIVGGGPAAMSADQPLHIQVMISPT